jgi:hypothetical protein
MEAESEGDSEEEAEWGAERTEVCIHVLFEKK